jgi:TPR repeat protein
MTLTAGTRLGHYNVTALIGEGDEIRMRQAGVADAQSNLGVMYANGKASRRMTSKRRCGPTSPSLSLPARIATGG